MAADPKDPIAESWTGGAYNGFSSGPAERPPPPPAASRRRNLVLGGLAGAVALGLVAGVLFRPELAENRAPAPMKAATAEALTEPMPVEVAKPEPPPTPKSAGKLEVLSPELARAAPRPAPVSRSYDVAVAPSAPAAAAPVVARVAEPPPIPARAQPSYDCADAGSRAERMVCGDEELARLDRRLDRAFNRAVASGVPARELRAEQDDWLQIREDAARRSPDAVASVYSQRIRELTDLAEGY